MTSHILRYVCAALFSVIRHDNVDIHFFPCTAQGGIPINMLNQYDSEEQHRINARSAAIRAIHPILKLAQPLELHCDIFFHNKWFLHTKSSTPTISIDPSICFLADYQHIISSSFFLLFHLFFTGYTEKSPATAGLFSTGCSGNHKGCCCFYGRNFLWYGGRATSPQRNRIK